MTGPQIVSGDHDKDAVHHDAMLREIESLRSQLTEARETLVRVAQTLGWDAPPEQVPSGIPDLAIAVQELRRQRDQARTARAEALVRAETERDEALCTIAKIAEALGFPGGDLRKAIHALRRERDDALQEAESVGWQLRSSTREVDRLISRLATVTGERDRWQQLAEDRVDWLRKRVRLAMDLLCSPTVPHEPGPDVPGAYSILGHALAATAPQSDEQTQVWGESHTKPAGTAHDALRRIGDHLDIPPWISPAEIAWRVIDEIDHLRRLANQASELGITDTDQPASARVDLVIGLRQRGVPQHPDGPEAAALAEIDRLHAALSATPDTGDTS